MDNKKIVIPKSKRGRKTKEQKIKYDNDLKSFSDSLIEINKQLEKPASSRGWCYILEGFNQIDKSQFDTVQKRINECRKIGYLPIGFVAEDKTRTFAHLEELQPEFTTPKDFLLGYLAFIRDIEKLKDDLSFWKTQECYIQMVVEKIDVFNLFEEICEQYHIPIANAKGWSDIHLRNTLAQNFRQAEEMGLKPILLYYADFDPVGIKIVESFKNNLKQIENATNWNPKNLIIDKIGLNFDFIEKHNLTWIDNLTTGSGKQANEKLAYVREYIKKYGKRKCEANAILIIPQIAKADCEIAILKHLGNDPLAKYRTELEKVQKDVLDLMNKTKYKKKIDKLMRDLK